jgi:thymidylate kinase
VAEGYRALAAGDPGRWRVVDGSGSVQDVEALVLAAIS